MIDKEKIQALAAEELADANTKHPPTFNSMHEAYAVLKEELEEAAEELEMCRERLDMLWLCVKNDDSLLTNKNLGYIKAYAVRAVQEFVQVVAMCDKALNCTEE